MNKTELEKILGYPPSREMMLQVLKYARSNQMTPMEAAQTFAMPNLLFENENGCFEFEGQTLTPDQLKKKYPFHRFIFIRSR